MTRKRALELITSYVAQGDTDMATRIYCENRISRAAFDEAYRKGQNLAALVASRK